MTKQEVPDVAIKKNWLGLSYHHQHLLQACCPCYDAMRPLAIMASFAKNKVYWSSGDLASDEAKCEYGLRCDLLFLHHRYELAQSGFFEPLEAKSCRIFGRRREVCRYRMREGSHLSYYLSAWRGSFMRKLISAKEGIHQASVHFGNEAPFFLGDFGKLAICDRIQDAVKYFNVELRRIHPGGTLVKVIPRMII